MRDCRLQLAEQFFRGQWLISVDSSIPTFIHLGKLLTQDKSEGPDQNQLLSDVYPIPMLGASVNGSDFGDSYDGLPAGSIAIFYISGTLLKYGTWYSYGMLEIAMQMRKAAYHKNVAGCMLVVDTGGGGVNAVAPIDDAISLFQALGKPVLAHCDSAYSAGYWLASKCDYIMMSNKISAGTGSIGVMSSFIDFKPYFEELKIVFHTIYAPESEEKNAAFELALKGDYDRIKTEHLSPLAINFQNQVKENRGARLILTDEKILKGATYSAIPSVANGLADSIGNTEDALNMLFGLIELKNFN